MPKRPIKSISPAPPKGHSFQAKNGEIVLSSTRTVVSNGIVSIDVTGLRVPARSPSWDNEELAEIYMGGDNY